MLISLQLKDNFQQLIMNSRFIGVVIMAHCKQYIFSPTQSIIFVFFYGYLNFRSATFCYLWYVFLVINISEWLLTWY
jgi:hypothetical protein